MALGGFWGVPLVISSPDCAVIRLSELPQTADQLGDWRLDGGGEVKDLSPTRAEGGMEELWSRHCGTAGVKSLDGAEGTHTEDDVRAESIAGL